MLDTMLDYVRTILYVALIFLGLLLYQAWEKDQTIAAKMSAAGLPNTMSMPESRNLPPTNINTLPPNTASESVVTKPDNTVLKGQVITVKTDLMEVQIDTVGGEIIHLNLLKFPETLGSNTPFLLFNDEEKTRYLAESGLLSTSGPDTSSAQAVYTVADTHFELQNDQANLNVILHWKNNEGLMVDKIFSFARNSYEIGVSYHVDNKSNLSWQGHLYAQLARTNAPPPNHSGFMNLATYFGAAISSPEKRFQKVNFDEMKKQNINQSIKSGWAAMVQHYFVSAWIPNDNETMNYYSKASANGLYTIGMISPVLQVNPGAAINANMKLYAGPAITQLLKQTAPGLQLTIDYGWFWFISMIIFWMMQKIHGLVGNWGWSIVLVTCLIKLLFYHLSAKSYRSMSALKRLQPRIEELKKRYGDDKQKITSATLELYRSEKVNPMSGCLPILIQIPVFIALYWVLVASVELRQAPFILWIHDLSQHDPYYVLAILMGVSMFFQQRLNPPPADPVQAKVMMFMPVIFTVLFANFPAGLLLYWVVNNTLSFLQQWYIMRQVDKVKDNKSVLITKS